MKVLVIGSGAREHAIAHALLRGGSVDEVTVAPCNPGMELDGIRTQRINPSNHAAMIEHRIIPAATARSVTTGNPRFTCKDCPKTPMFCNRR